MLKINYMAFDTYTIELISFKSKECKKTVLNNKYFVDSSIFDATYMHLDYKAIMSTAGMQI